MVLTDTKTDSNRPKVKICGVRDPAHGLVAVECGVDFIGMMFYPGSSRYITIEQACRLSTVVGNRVKRVGVFVNPSQKQLEDVLAAVELDMLQFHGDESNAECQRWGLPWIKAVQVKEAVTAESLAQRWPDASALLLDAYCGNDYGGLGQRFDWHLFPTDSANKLKVPLILAGGLTPENVREAIAQLQPWAVDVSSGVEKLRGVKDAGLIRRFMEEVNHVSNV